MGLVSLRACAFFSASQTVEQFVLLTSVLNSVLKLNIQKTKLLASGPITSWQIEGETVIDFILGGSRITADGDCSHEVGSLLLGRKAMTNLDSMLKSRDVTLPAKVHQGYALSSSRVWM